MRIGLNTLAAARISGGDGLYLRDLVSGLQALPSGHHFRLFCSTDNQALFPLTAEHWQKDVSRLRWRSLVYRALWEQLRLPSLARSASLDLFHAPVNVMPLRLSASAVLTVHDIVPFAWPELIPLPLRWYWRYFRSRSARRARRIIAVSESSKAEIVRYMDVPAEKIDVVYQTVSAAFRACPPGEPSATPPYFLWVGRPYATKNVPRLLRAFSAAKREAHFPHQLWLVGPKGWDEALIRQLIVALALRDDVRRLGFVAPGTLPALYRGATALLYPSLNESFGRPVLEAMACGVPALVGGGALPEIGGPCVLRVDPHDEASISAGILRLWQDASLRSEMAACGQRRAREFTLERMARATLSVYEKAASA